MDGSNFPEILYKQQLETVSYINLYLGYLFCLKYLRLRFDIMSVYTA